MNRTAKEAGDRESIEAELLRVEPQAERVRLGAHNVLKFPCVTRAHSYISIIKVIDSGKVVELVARDSFVESLAVHLLDQTDKHELSDGNSDGIKVHPSPFPEPWKFNTTVVIPPTIARRFEHQSEVLSRITYWVIPAFTEEFKDGDNRPTFQHQIGRKDGWRVHVIDWSRELKTTRNWD